MTFSAFRRVAAILFSFFVSLTSFAQDQWTASAPPITGITHGNGLFVVACARGQILSSPDQITWTLADLDTLVPLNSVTFGAGVFVAVGSNGRILSSSNAIDWTSRASNTTNQLNSVTFANGKFVAVGNQGEALTSSDGATWEEQFVPPIFDFSLNSVTFGNSQFVAVGTRGVVFTSADGNIWVNQNSGVSFPIYSVASTGTNFVAVTGSGPQNILISPDAVNWTVKNSGIDEALWSVTASSSLYVAVGYGGTIATSPDGVTWTRRQSDTTEDLLTVAYINDGFFAAGNQGTITVAGSGINWSQSTGLGHDNFVDSVYGEGKFVLVAERAASSFVPTATSDNGLLWRYWNSARTDQFKGVAYGTNIFVAVTEDSATSNGSLLNSNDGRSWTPASTQFPAVTWEKVAYGGNRFVAVGSSDDFPPAVIAVSTNGQDWVQRDLDTFSQLQGIFYGDQLYVATGSGKIMTSTDSVTWGEKFSNNQFVFYSGAYGNGTYVVVGENPFGIHRGIAVTSTDGIHWTLGPDETYDTFNDVTFADGKFYAVGNHSSTANSSIFSSTDGVTWTPETMPFTSQPLKTITAGPNSLIAAGQFGTAFTKPIEGVKKLPAFTAFNVIAPNPADSGFPWSFNAKLSSTATGLTVRVQSTLTPLNEGSWTDLPGGGYMTGQDGTWSLTTRQIPSGTRYFRAIAAAPGFQDSISTPSGPTEVGAGISDFEYFTTAPERATNQWQFTATDRLLLSDQRLRVQYSTTPDIEGSWTDLPGGGIMSHLDSRYSLTTSDVPQGDLYFRIISSAPGYPDEISAQIGPVHVSANLPQVTQTVSTSQTIEIGSLPGANQNQQIDLKALKGVLLQLITTPDNAPEIITAALQMSADPGALIELIVQTAKTLEIPEIDALLNSRIISKGIIDGNVNLIGAAIGSLIQQNPELTGKLATAILAHDPDQLAANIASGSLDLSDLADIDPNGLAILAAQFSNFNTGTAAPSNLKAAIHIDPFTLADITGRTVIIGDYLQSAASALSITIGGPNFSEADGYLYDRLEVNGTARLSGVLGFGFVNLGNVSDPAHAYQPPVGTPFDVVVANRIVVTNLIVRGPIWADGRHFQWHIVDLKGGKQALQLTAVNIAPPLNLIKSGANLQLVYPTNYTGYVIQSAPAITNTTWTTISSTTNRLNIDPTAKAQFFRLLKP